MSSIEINARVLIPGSARAQAMVLDEPLSFWGGFDARTGTIVDRQHPQCGCCVAGMFLILPESRGSAGTPAGIAEAIRGGGCGGDGRTVQDRRSVACAQVNVWNG